MIVAEELREWALYDKWADVNNLTTPAWHTLSEHMDHSFGLSCGWPRDDATFRTFALLVAEALESER
mgnify:FL=1